LQSKIHSSEVYIFSRQYFFCIGEGNFGGKKITLEKSEFTLQMRFFQFETLPPGNLQNLLGHQNQEIRPKHQK
jgi:hypothetical protein